MAMTLKALVLTKGHPNPPQMSVAVSLVQVGYDTLFVASQASEATRRYLEGRGVKMLELQPHAAAPRHLLTKAAYWWEFRRKAWHVLEQQGRVDLLWIGSADTALALGRRLLQRAYIFQIHELYDSLPFYRRHLRDYARAAKVVVVPEANRAAIFRSWYGLRRTPYVLPNKPLEHPRQRGLPITNEEARAALATVPADTRLVLYQGIIHPERDIRPVGRAVAELGPGWKFVVAGDDQGFLGAIRAACPEMLYVPYVPPPQHLEVTSRATIGVLAYCFDNLNNVFCAPNKVWEYAGFGLPMLGNDVPGLRLIEEHQAGLCADFHQPTAVKRALLELVRNQQRYSQAARLLYDRFEVGEVVQEIAAAA
jgi:glycosyltransferase involved in cell wall biosynthesis